MKSTIFLGYTKLLCLCLAFIVSIQSKAGNYTWTGSTSNDWATSTNWSPNGFPTTLDSVTITSGSNNCLLSSNNKIHQLIVTMDTIDLNGYTLSVNEDVTFTDGLITNGKLETFGTGTAIFSGGVVDVKLDLRGSDIQFSGSTFTDSIYAVKKGSSFSFGEGGCTFESAVTLIDSSDYLWVFSNTYPDTFKDKVLVIQANNSGVIVLPFAAEGNSFEKSVTLSNLSNGYIFSSPYGSTVFHDSLILNSTGTGEIYFGEDGGISTLDTSIVVIGTSGLSSSSKLYLHGFHQLDATKIISLTGTGTSQISIDNHAEFYGDISITAPKLNIRNSRFLGEARILHTSANTSAGISGSYFEDSTFITHNAHGGAFFIGTASVDTFAGPVLIHNADSGKLAIKSAWFQNETYLLNESSGGTSLKFDHTLTPFLVGNGGACLFEDSLTVNSSGGSMVFFTGTKNGKITLSENCIFNLLSTYTGELLLGDIEQLGTNEFIIPFQNNANLLYLDSGNSFEAPVIINAQQIELKGNYFQNDFYLKRTGSTSDTCSGLNFFMGNATIIDSSATSHYFFLSSEYPNVFADSTTFKQYGGSVIDPCNIMDAFFVGDINVDGSSQIVFGRNGGKAIIYGDEEMNHETQYIVKSGSYYPEIKKLEINKYQGELILQTSLKVTDTLFFSSGIIISDSLNYLEISDNGVTSGAFDGSYVDGFVKKVGNDTFSFPLGSSGQYHPLSISAPSSITDAFSASYINEDHGLGSNSDSAIENESICEYWKLYQTNGTDSLIVELGWNTRSCNVVGFDSMRVAIWDTTLHKWKDKGNGGTSGTLSVGSVTSSDSISIFGIMTIADLLCTSFNPATTSENIHCKNDSSGWAYTNVTGGTSPYDYAWSYGAITTNEASPLPPGTYTVMINDARGCSDTDTVIITEPLTLFTLDSIHVTDELCYGSSADGTAKVFASNGDLPYQYLWYTEFWQYTDSISELNSGSYIVVVIDSNGCERTDTADVGFGSLIDIEFVTSLVTTLTNDDGKATAIVSGAKLPVSYLWDSDPEQTEATATDLPVNTYNLTVTDDNGCELTRGIFLDSLPSTAAISPCEGIFDIEGPFSQCGLYDIWSLNNNHVFHYNSFNGDPLTWSTSSHISIQGSNYGTSIDVEFTSAPSAGDFISAVDANGCSIALYVQACCTSPYPVHWTLNDFNEDNFSWTNPNLAAVLGVIPDGNGGFENSSPWTYNINGEFALSMHGIHFQNCTFVMGPGALFFSSLVECPNPSTDSLRFDNCIFIASCDTMWGGIRVPTHGYLGLNDCQLYDAQYGIKDCDQELFLNSTNTYYERNYVSIFAPTNSSLNFLTPPASICLWSILSGNTFSGNALLVAPFFGQKPPPQGNASFAGILVNDFEAAPHVNNPSRFVFYWDTTITQRNIFRDLNIGICGINSDIDVYNCEFENIQPVPAYHASHNYNGSAIYCESKTASRILRARIGDEDAVGIYMNNSFTNCWRDIFCKGTQNTDIKYNKSAYNISKSIEVRSAFANNSNINNNRIRFAHFGIHCNSNQFTHTTIHDNEIITRKVRTDVGIRVNDIMPFSGFTDIADNNITAYGKYGIHIQNNSYGHIYQNTIYEKLPQLWGILNSFYGIRDDNGYSNLTRCNIVNGVTPNMTPLRYAITNSFSPIGDVSCNQTDHTNIAFSFHGTCDPTNFYGNTLSNHYDGLVLGLANLSGGEIGPQEDQFPGGTLSGNTYLGGNGLGTFGEYATLSINSNMNNYPFWVKPGSYHPATNGLLGTTGNAISPTNQPPSPYNCSGNPCDIFALPFASQFITDTMEADNTNRDVMRRHYERTLTTFLLMNPSYLDSTSELDSFSDSIAGTNAGKFGLINYFIMSSDTNSSGYIIDSIISHIESAYELNAGIYPESDQELYQQLVNTIKLNSFGSGRFELEQNEVETLLYIAYLCPYIFGPCVYDARSMLTNANSSFYIADEEVCFEEEELRRANPENKLPMAQAVLFPNPASNQIEILFNRPLEYDVSFEILNFAGQTILTGQIKSPKVNTIHDVSSLPSGIFNFRIFSSSGMTYSQKFTIIK